VRATGAAPRVPPPKGGAVLHAATGPAPATPSTRAGSISAVDAAFAFIWSRRSPFPPSRSYLGPDWRFARGQSPAISSQPRQQSVSSFRPLPHLLQGVRPRHYRLAHRGRPLSRFPLRSSSSCGPDRPLIAPSSRTSSGSPHTVLTSSSATISCFRRGRLRLRTLRKTVSHLASAACSHHRWADSAAAACVVYHFARGGFRRWLAIIFRPRGCVVAEVRVTQAPTSALFEQMLHTARRHCGSLTAAFGNRYPAPSWQWPCSTSAGDCAPIWRGESARARWRRFHRLVARAGVQRCSRTGRYCALVGAVFIVLPRSSHRLPCRSEARGAARFSWWSQL
jgi:hypothetical protein